MWFDAGKQKKEEKEKTAVALAYEPGDAAPKILATGKASWRSASLKRQRKAMYRFMRTISLRKHFRSFGLAIPYRRSCMRSLRKSWYL